MAAKDVAVDWSQFSNPRGSEALQWRKVMGVPTTHVAGRRIELFKELVWKEWRHVPMWGYRVDGVAQPERFRTMRQAKAQAELHARRIIAAGETSVRPAAVPAEIETKRRPKRTPLERKEWWGISENPHPPKRQLEAAVRDMQVYLGASRPGTVRVRDAQKLYDRVRKKVDRIADKAGISVESAWDQIEAEARRRGVVSPMPGKDF